MTKSEKIAIITARILASDDSPAISIPREFGEFNMTIHECPLDVSTAAWNRYNERMEKYEREQDP